jgi:integrase
LAETARDYARGAKAAATQRAYAADWRHYTAWCRRKELEPLPPDPQVVGLYLAASASEPPAPGKKPNAVRTIERRLSAIAWNCAQRGQPLDRADRHIAEVMSGIRRRHARPPDQIATLGHDLRGLRDRAILLIGFAGGLRRSEITGLDCGPDHTEDGAGWIEFLDQGLLIRVRGKTGWREVEIGRGSSELTCPVVALEAWLSGEKAERGAHHRTAALGHRLGLRPARPATRPRRPPHRRSDERHPAPPRPAARPEGGRFRRGFDAHGRDAGPRSAGRAAVAGRPESP